MNESNLWKPASGHRGGWRVVKGVCPMEELNGPKGKLLLFKTYESAKKRADKVNAADFSQSKNQ